MSEGCYRIALSLFILHYHQLVSVIKMAMKRLSLDHYSLLNQDQLGRSHKNHLSLHSRTIIRYSIVFIHSLIIYCCSLSSKNPGNDIIVKNIPPSKWAGQEFDVIMYKDSRPLITITLNVGLNGVFLLSPYLYLELKCSKTGETQSCDQSCDPPIEASYDLTEFPRGLIVTLTKHNGKYIFVPACAR